MESTVDKLMECGREATEQLNKANETINQLQSENATLRNELSKANAVICGLRSENEALRKENERIAELERKAALWDAYEEHQTAKRKAMEDIENYKRLEQEAIALRQESEKKLAELLKGDGYVA
jgi:ribosomal protein L16 Arg81 hydroxylase